MLSGLEPAAALVARLALLAAWLAIGTGTGELPACHGGKRFLATYVKGVQARFIPGRQGLVDMSCSACWAVPPAIGVSGHILSLFYFLLLCLNEKGMRGKSKKNLEVAMKSKGLALAFRLASREVQSLTVRLLVRQQHWALCCVTSREEDLTQSDSASVITSCVETAWGACMMHQVKVGIVGCCKAPYCTVPLGLSIGM